MLLLNLLISSIPTLSTGYFNTSYVVIKLYLDDIQKFGGIDFNTSYVVIKPYLGTDPNYILVFQYILCCY